MLSGLSNNFLRPPNAFVELYVYCGIVKLIITNQLTISIVSQDFKFRTCIITAYRKSYLN